MAQARYKANIVKRFLQLSIAVSLVSSHALYALSIDRLRNDVFNFGSAQLIQGQAERSIDTGAKSLVINNPQTDLQITISEDPINTNITQNSPRNVFRANFARGEAPCNASIDAIIEVRDSAGNLSRLSDPNNAQNFISINYEPIEHRRQCYANNGGVRRIIYRFALRLTDLTQAGNARQFRGQATLFISSP